MLNPAYYYMIIIPVYIILIFKSQASADNFDDMAILKKGIKHILQCKRELQ